MGRPEDVIPSLLSSAEGCTNVVLCQSEVTSEEVKVEKAVMQAIKPAAGGKLIRIWGSTLYHLDDLPFDEELNSLPDVFTPFRNKVESKCEVRRMCASVSNGALPLPQGKEGMMGEG